MCMCMVYLSVCVVHLSVCGVGGVCVYMCVSVLYVVYLYVVCVCVRVVYLSVRGVCEV